MRALEIAGQRFNKLTVIKKGSNKNGKARWICRCDCGTMSTIITSQIINGHTKTCGCARGGVKTHGLTNTSEYVIWCAIVQRTTNPKCKAYYSYGGRGIDLCERWREFKNFYKDMGPRPEFYTVERMDNNKGYSPSNCKWDTRKSQARNTRRNRYITIDNITKSLAEWHEESPVCKGTFYNRKRRGFSDKEALGLGDFNACK